MATYTYKVENLKSISDSVYEMANKFPEALKESLNQSIEINVRGPSMKKVPISDPNRYAPKKKGKRSWSKSYQPNQSGSLQKSYGVKIEYNSSSELHATMFYDAKKMGADGVERGYAKFVHDMKDPTASGKPVQWSRPGSGNKFLTEFAEKNKDDVFKDMAEFMGKRLFK